MTKYIIVSGMCIRDNRRIRFCNCVSWSGLFIILFIPKCHGTNCSNLNKYDKKKT